MSGFVGLPQQPMPMDPAQRRQMLAQALMQRPWAMDMPRQPAQPPQMQPGAPPPMMPAGGPARMAPQGGMPPAMAGQRPMGGPRPMAGAPPMGMAAMPGQPRR
jgi:hypothetical protein